jgi:integrase
VSCSDQDVQVFRSGNADALIDKTQQADGPPGFRSSGHWTYLVTGARRGEVLALRWEHLDLTTGVLTIRHSVSEQRGGATTTKGTKTHQIRRISLDAQTMTLLIEHRERVIARCTEIGAGFDDLRFIFSYTPDRAARAR